MKKYFRTVKWWIFLPLVPVFLLPACGFLSRFWFFMHISILGRLYGELAFLSVFALVPNMIFAVALCGARSREALEPFWLWVLLIPSLVFCAFLYLVSLALELSRGWRTAHARRRSLSREGAQALALIFPILGILCFLIAAATGLRQSGSWFPLQRNGIEWFVAALILASIGGLFFGYARRRPQNI
jgi:hypothetical protein